MNRDCRSSTSALQAFMRFHDLARVRSRKGSTTFLWFERQDDRKTESVAIALAPDATQALVG